MSLTTCDCGMPFCVEDGCAFKVRDELDITKDAIAELKSILQPFIDDCKKSDIEIVLSATKLAASEIERLNAKIQSLVIERRLMKELITHSMNNCSKE